jgi:hypothetical protein
MAARLPGLLLAATLALAGVCFAQPPAPTTSAAPAGKEAVGVLGSRDARSAYFAATGLVEATLKSLQVPFVSGAYPKPDAPHPGVVIVLPGNPSKDDVARLTAFLSGGGKAICLGFPGTDIATALGFDFPTPSDSPPEVAAVAFADDALRGAPECWVQYPERISEPKSGDGRACGWYANADGARTERVAAWRSGSALALGFTPDASDQRGLGQFLLAALASFDEVAARDALRPVLQNLGAVGTFKSLGTIQAYVSTQGNEGSRRLLDTALESYHKAQAAVDAGPVGELVTDTSTALALLREAVYSAETGVPGEIRGAFAGPAPPGRGGQLAEMLAEAGLNTVFLYAGDSMNPVYPSTVTPGKADEPDAFGESASALARSDNPPGLFAWRACFYCAQLTEESRAALRKEGRLAIAGSGDAADYLCPSNEQNLAYEESAIAELLTRYPVQGIVLDFARFPSQNYCYCPACREAFKAYDAAMAANWPPLGGPQQVAFEQFRVAQVTKAVLRLAAAARAARPGVVVAATTLGQSRNAKRTVGQDPEQWVGEGGVDMVVPLLYGEISSELATRLRTLSLGLRGRALLVPARAPWPSNAVPEDPLVTLAELRSLRAVQVDGVAYFALQLARSRDLALALGAGAFRQPADPGYRWPLHVAFDPAPFPDIAPNAYSAEQPARFRLDLGGAASGNLAMTARSLEADSRRDVGSVAIQDGRAEVTADLPPGLWRLCLEGTVTTTAGTEAPILRRGPVVRVLTPDETKTAQEAVREAGRLDIALYQDGRGIEAISDALRGGLEGERDIRVLSTLTAEDLANVDLLVIQDPTQPRAFDEKVQDTLDQWVVGGGRLLLLHDAVGHRGMPVLFPTVAATEERDRSKSATVRVADRSHPAAAFLDTAPTIPTENEDHALVRPNTPATGLLVDEIAGDPGAFVAVAAQYGAGRIVLCGVGFGFKGLEEEMRLTRDQADLLVGLARWLIQGSVRGPAAPPAPPR